MKLEFDFYKRGKYYGVNIWVRTIQLDLFDKDYDSREYLEEYQYNSIYIWCAKTFNSENQPYRVRRMAFADFWFASQRDLDWFILNWSGVDSASV